MRTLGIILWFSFVPSICIAQDSIADRKSFIVIGGELLWNSSRDLKENSGYKNVNISSKVKFGYFLSTKDLILIRPRITVDLITDKSAEYTNNEVAIGGEFVYRRFFGSSLFGGIFLGGDCERKKSSRSISPRPQYDKELYYGIELGYIIFLNPHVGIESTLYYSAGKITAVRYEYTNNLYYSKGGITIGFIYIFNRQTHEKK